jgi:hypothetical protein
MANDVYPQRLALVRLLSAVGTISAWCNTAVDRMTCDTAAIHDQRRHGRAIVPGSGAVKQTVDKGP